MDILSRRGFAQGILSPARRRAGGLSLSVACAYRASSERADVRRQGQATKGKKRRFGEADSFRPIQNFASALRAFRLSALVDDVGDRFASEARKMHDKIEMKEALEDEAEESSYGQKSERID